MRSVIGENIFSTHCDLASDLGTLMPAIKSATRSTRSILRATRLISNHIGSSQFQEKVISRMKKICKGAYSWIQLTHNMTKDCSLIY